MSTPSLTDITHRFLGPMRRLTVAPGVAWELTQQEAWTLARAMTALGHNRSLAEEIYLSPQGSDHEFLAKVCEEGLVVQAAEQRIHIAWPEVATLAEALSY